MKQFRILIVDDEERIVNFLISAEIMRGRRVTSWPSIAVDLRNAGAEWIDAPVVRDENIITSRKPADLPRFNKAIIEALRDRH